MPPPPPSEADAEDTSARPSPGRRRRRRLLLLILCLGLGLRILAAGYSGDIKRDGAFYAELGSHLTQGDLAGIFHPKSTPLYPFLIGLVHFLVADLELSGLIVSVIAGTLTILAVYWLGKMLFDERIALLAAGLCAVHPYLVRYSGYVMTEATYTLTFAVALGVIWWALLRRGWWRYALAGAAIGLSYLARLEGLGLAALLALGTLLPPKRLPLGGESSEPTRKRRLTLDLVGLLLVGVVFLLVVSPQVYFVKQQMGVWTLTSKAGISAQRHRMSGEDFERYKRSLTPDRRALVVQAVFDKRYRGALLAERAPREGLAGLAGRWLKVEGDLLGFLPEVHGPLLLLLFVGLFYRRTYARKRGPETYLGACLVLYLAALAFFQGSDRNLMALTVPMLFWMAVGLAEVTAWRRRATARQRRWLEGALALLALGTVLMTFWFLPRADWRWRGSAEKDVGLWVKEEVGPGRTILALHRTIPFYAGAHFVGLPFASYDDTMTYARLNHVDVLLLEPWYVDRSPELARFITRVPLDPRWQWVARTDANTGRRGRGRSYVLYRLRPEADAPPEPDGQQGSCQ